MVTSALGWAASVILLATLVKQTVKLYRERNCDGVSRWLFIGQITASVLFTVYSVLLKSWVFSVTNFLLLCDAIAGQVIVARNKRRTA